MPLRDVRMGEIYGSWEVLGNAPTAITEKWHSRCYKCKCNCGKIRFIPISKLLKPNKGCRMCCDKSRTNTIHPVLNKLLIMNPTTLSSGCWEYTGCKDGHGYGI